MVTTADILIIEDDAVIRTELKILLERYGYNVITTENFGDTASFIAANAPHLVLLDINLPVYDGYYICKEIRRISKVPIIVVTSRDSDMDELMSMNLGADDFVVKPYNTQILLARINALLNRVYNTETSNVINFAGVTLDIGKSLVTYGAESAELTKNELRILDILTKSKGEIVSRDDIMNGLWQSNEFVDDNTLTVNINRLRKKLDEIGAVDILKTKRGQGYSLCR
jgi:DNA-binding response OmpR family regulator